MSTLLDSARVTLSPGVFWKSCRRCAGLFPGAPDQLCCRDCASVELPTAAGGPLLAGGGW
jgi:hypothetical protein